MNSSKYFSLDFLGVGLSGLCLAHCLLLPLLPIMAVAQNLWFWHNENLHLGLLVLILPTAVLALGMGYVKHRKRSVLVFGAAGVLLLVAGWASEHIFGTILEKAATICGGILLTVAHWINQRKRCGLPR